MFNRKGNDVTLRTANVRLCVIIDHGGFIDDAAPKSLELKGGQDRAPVTHDSALHDVDNNVTLL